MTNRSTRRTLTIAAVVVLVVAAVGVGFYLLGRSTTDPAAHHDAPTPRPDSRPPRPRRTPRPTRTARPSPACRGAGRPPARAAPRPARRPAARLHPRPDRRRQRRHQLPDVDELDQDRRQGHRRRHGRQRRRRPGHPDGPDRAPSTSCASGMDEPHRRPARTGPRRVRGRRLQRRAAPWSTSGHPRSPPTATGRPTTSGPSTRSRWSGRRTTGSSTQALDRQDRRRGRRPQRPGRQPERRRRSIPS